MSSAEKTSFSAPILAGAAALVLSTQPALTGAQAAEISHDIKGHVICRKDSKFIVWIIPTNLGEALMLLSTIVLGLPLPLLPLQLLCINLTDSLLGLSLVFEPQEGDVMSRPPRNPKRPLLTFPLIMRTGLVTLIMVIGGLSAFRWELRIEQAAIVAAPTAAVNVVVLVEVVYLFNCRSLHHSVFAIRLFTNRWTIVASLAMVGPQLLFTYAPVMNNLFHSAPLSAESWMRIVGVAAIAFTAVELEKWIRFGRRHGEQAIPA